MNQFIPQDTIEYLKSIQITTDSAKRVLRMIIKNEKTSDETEAEIYIALQVLLASNYSQAKMTEILSSLGFPEDFISDFTNAFPSLPKIRSGITLPLLVDVN